jgi:hypothetical protein
MTKTLVSVRSEADAARRAAYRPVLILIAGFLAVSAAMEALLIVVTAIGPGIDIAVWIRCTLVLGSSVILLIFAVGASRGSRTAWIRLRLVTGIVVVAVVVIVSIPGFLPDWVRAEQAVCGALVLPAAILVNLPRARTHFPPKDRV